MLHALPSPTATFEGSSGRYRIQGSLGLPGATAEVYRVERSEDGHQFALKLPRPGLASELARRFEGEMGVLRRLAASEERLGTHHVPRVIECSALREEATQRLAREFGRPFLIMELAPGRDLVAVLDQEPLLSEPEAVELARQFAETLLAAHEVGIGYADMKMENLFWDRAARRLMVIDWNVVSEGLNATEAHRDRLRAGAFLCRWLTGEAPKVIGDAAEGFRLADQRFAVAPAFRRLSSGIQRLLRESITAAEPTADLGAAEATRSAVDTLAFHAYRLERSADELLERGREASADRQWLEAYEVLELAQRRAPAAWPRDRVEQVGRLVEAARREVEEQGRRAYRSGRGRLENGLHAEAVADFERARGEDPLDDEARLWLQVARLAVKIRRERFSLLLPALGEAIEAFRRGRLALAGAALARLDAEASAAPEIVSLGAEIELHRGLEQATDLLERDEIAKAIEELRRVYSHRARLLDEEPLREVIAALSARLNAAEEMARLTVDGASRVAREDFGGAREVLGRAWRLAPANGAARRRAKWAERLAGLAAIVDSATAEEAVTACTEARREAPDDPALGHLADRALSRRCKELEEQAEAVRQTCEPEREGAILERLLEISPDHPMAQRRLAALAQRETAVAEAKLGELESKLESERSAAVGAQVLSELEASGLGASGRGRQLEAKARRLHQQAVELARQIERHETRGELDKFLAVVAQAEEKRIVLRQGAPAELRRRVERRLFELHHREIEQLLDGGEPARAAKVAEAWFATEHNEERRGNFRELMNRARQDVERAQRVAASKQRPVGPPPQPATAGSEGPVPKVETGPAFDQTAANQLAELQRRVLEEARREPTLSERQLLARVSRTRPLNAVAQRYRLRERKVAARIKQLADRGELCEAELVALRLEHGEFPRLAETLVTVRRERAAEATRERFLRTVTYRDSAEVAASWSKWPEVIAAIDPEHLSEEDRCRYRELEEAVRFGEILVSPIGEQLSLYLQQPQLFNGLEGWLEAVTWAGVHHCAELAGQHRKELRASMRELLDQGEVRVESLSAFFFLRSRMEESREWPGSTEELSVGEPVQGSVVAMRRRIIGVSRWLAGSLRTLLSRGRRGQKRRRFRRHLAHGEGAKALTELYSLAGTHSRCDSAITFEAIIQEQRKLWGRFLDRNGAVRPLVRWRLLRSPGLWVTALGVLAGVVLGWQLHERKNLIAEQPSSNHQDVAHAGPVVEDRKIHNSPAFRCGLGEVPAELKVLLDPGRSRRDQ